MGKEAAWDSKDAGAAASGSHPSVAVGQRVKNTRNRCAYVTSIGTGGYFTVKFDDGDEDQRPIANFTTMDGKVLAEDSNASSGGAASWDKKDSHNSGGGAGASSTSAGRWQKEAAPEASWDNWKPKGGQEKSEPSSSARPWDHWQAAGADSVGSPKQDEGGWGNW